MKTSQTRRKSKTPEAKLREKLWGLCKDITRKKYRLRNGAWSCFTCDAIIRDKAFAHTGHFIPSSTCGAYLRYDLRNLRIQCFRCNINLGGNGAEYYKRLVAEVGQEAVDELFKDKNRIVKADKNFYESKILLYQLLS